MNYYPQYYLTMRNGVGIDRVIDVLSESEHVVPRKIATETHIGMRLVLTPQRGAYSIHGIVKGASATATRSQLVELSALIQRELAYSEDEYAARDRRVRWYDILNGESSNWSSHDEDMKKVSEAYPDTIFILACVEEEDAYRTYYVAGKMETVRPEWVYPEPQLVTDATS